MWIIAQDGTAVNMDRLNRIYIIQKRWGENDEAHLYAGDGSNEPYLLFVGTLQETYYAQETVLSAYVDDRKLVGLLMLPSKINNTENIPF